MIDLGSFGGANGFSNALNNRGQVIGGSSIATNPGACFFLGFNPGCHPFLWDQGTIIDLQTSTSGGSPLSADWFNEKTEIVGFADFPTEPFDAYFWKNGAATDLGHLNGDCFSRAWGINSRSQVVGTSLRCDFSFHHAFLWENGSLVDLNDLIPPNSPLELVTIGALSNVLVPNINDRGEIVGVGVPPGCDDLIMCGHAFLLIPCDESHRNMQGCDYSMLDESTAVTGASSMPVTQKTTANQRNPWLRGPANPMLRRFAGRLMPWQRDLALRPQK